MGSQGDHGVPSVEVWKECLRVLKPGGMLLAFGGTRTHHRLTCAIEDAGFEIRDCLMWLYGSGYPKSLKASTRERNAGVNKNPHPCLKPISLTKYFATLILPPAGKKRKLLIPFSGAGSEMIGALLAGWDSVVGIEKCAQYAKISKARIKHRLKEAKN